MYEISAISQHYAKNRCSGYLFFLVIPLFFSSLPKSLATTEVHNMLTPKLQFFCHVLQGHFMNPIDFIIQKATIYSSSWSIKNRIKVSCSTNMPFLEKKIRTNLGSLSTKLYKQLKTILFLGSI